MLERDPLACLLRNADMYEYALLSASKANYLNYEELRKKGICFFERDTLARLLRDAEAYEYAYEHALF